MPTQNRAGSACRAAQLGAIASRARASLTPVDAFSTPASLPIGASFPAMPGIQNPTQWATTTPSTVPCDHQVTMITHKQTAALYLQCQVGYSDKNVARTSNNGFYANQNRRAHAVTMRCYLMLAKKESKNINGVTNTQIASRASRILPIMRTKASTRALPVLPLVSLS